MVYTYYSRHLYSIEFSWLAFEELALTWEDRESFLWRAHWLK